LQFLVPRRFLRVHHRHDHSIEALGGGIRQRLVLDTPVRQPADDKQRPQEQHKRHAHRQDRQRSGPVQIFGQSVFVQGVRFAVGVFCGARLGGLAARNAGR